MTSFLFVLLPLFAIAVATSLGLMRVFGPADEAGKFVCVDGLRGYLSLLVYAHHGAIWYALSLGHPWGQGLPRVLENAGPLAVTLFFMITGFLFIRKITTGARTDWGALYFHRLFRLAPLYGVAVAVATAIALLATPVREPLWRIAAEIGTWLTFGVFGLPPIGGYAPSWKITAAVQWTLAVEWFLYFLLPTFALALGRRPSWRVWLPTAALATLVAAFAAKDGWVGWSREVNLFIGFVGAPIALYLCERDAVRRFARSRSGSLVAVLCLLQALRVPGYGLVQVLLLSGAFSLVASGCSLFGLLTRPWSLFLGQGGYGLYLFHAILLFLAFGLHPQPWSLQAHWAIVLAMTPALVVASTVAFRFVERPGMRAGKALAKAAWTRWRAPARPALHGAGAGGSAD